MSNIAKRWKASLPSVQQSVWQEASLPSVQQNVWQKLSLPDYFVLGKYGIVNE